VDRLRHIHASAVASLVPLLWWGDGSQIARGFHEGPSRKGYGARARQYWHPAATINPKLKHDISETLDPPLQYFEALIVILIVTGRVGNGFCV
jgi:hypothetical protein